MTSSAAAGTLRLHMGAAASRLYHRTSLPLRLQVTAAIAYLAVFSILTAVDRPGLGIGQAFYIPIILFALGGTVTGGVCAGLTAAALYVTALSVHGASGGSFATTRIAIHLLTYVAAGALTGYFATRARAMLRDALRVLDDLLRLAHRDPGTGAHDRDGLDRSLRERMSARAPFTFVVGSLEDGECDDGALRHASRLALGELEPGAEIARIGREHLGIVTSGRAGMGQAVARGLERALASGGRRATFGWAVHPADGEDSWTLFRVASERLYARRFELERPA